MALYTNKQLVSNGPKSLPVPLPLPMPLPEHRRIKVLHKIRTSGKGTGMGMGKGATAILHVIFINGEIMSLKHLLLIILLASTFTLPVEGGKRNKNDCSITLLARDVGMFSVMYDVLGLLQMYDNGLLKGIQVDFGRTGLYYDQNVGPNWWSYYFEPIRCGTIDKKYSKKVFGDSRPLTHPIFIEYRMTRETANRLIQKYIKIKLEICEEIERFIDQHFKGHTIIGVHYRGTDKHVEAPRVDYDSVVEEICRQLEMVNSDKYKIFVATDEADFIDYTISLFGDKVCYNESALRSSNKTPIHSSIKHGQYEHGKEALIDCILLSRTDCLIRTSSNLSKFSTFFNSNLNVIELNKRIR